MGAALLLRRGGDVRAPLLIMLLSASRRRNRATRRGTGASPLASPARSCVCGWPGYMCVQS